MNLVTLGVIVLAVLLVAAIVLVLRRRSQDSSYGRVPLALDDTSFSAPALTNSADGSRLNRPPATPPSAVAVPATADMSEVYALMRQGNKIAAIKRLRELTGLGLKEAKDYVEAMPSDGPLSALPQAGTTPLAGAVDLAEVYALAHRGHKIEAIKRYRELTGVGLKEAKDYVEAMSSGGPLPALSRTSSTPPAGAGDLAEVLALAQQGRKIEAIKRYRALTGVGLKEAKDYVDRL